MKKLLYRLLISSTLAGCGHLGASPSPPVLPAGWKQLSIQVNPLKMGSEPAETVSLSVGLPRGWRNVDKAEDPQTVLVEPSGKESPYPLFLIRGPVEPNALRPNIRVTVSQIPTWLHAQELIDIDVKNVGKNLGVICKHITKPETVHLALGDGTAVSYENPYVEEGAVGDMNMKEYWVLTGNLEVRITWEVPANSHLENEADAIVKTLYVR